MIERPVLRYHGGKWKLAEWIISHFPQHRVYVEPFGGAGSVLIRKTRSYAEVYNDRWETVVNVFRVLRDPDLAEQLRQQLELTPFARTEFEKCKHNPRDNQVERARKTHPALLRRLRVGLDQWQPLHRLSGLFHALGHRAGRGLAQLALAHSSLRRAAPGRLHRESGRR